MAARSVGRLARNEVISSAATPFWDFSALALFSHDVSDSLPLTRSLSVEQYSRGPTNKDLSSEIRKGPNTTGSGIRRAREGVM